MSLVALVLIASFFMTPSASIDKEGFVTYVVYGPGGPFGQWPGYGRGWGGVQMDGLTDTGLIGGGADIRGRDHALVLGAPTTKV